MSRKLKRKSFISEHSAGFVLAPNLGAILAASYSTVIPIFFWATREGTDFASEGFAGRRVKVLTVFPRRPKMDPKLPGCLFLKLNEQLFRYAQASRNSGLPVLAGMPLAKNLGELTFGCPCVWVHLTGVDEEPADETFELKPQTDQRTPRWKRAHAEQILKLLAAAPAMEWREAAGSLRQARSASNTMPGWPYGSGYRPFNLLVIV